MNRKARKTQNVKGGPNLFEEAGPLFAECLRRLGPPEEARRHFQTARVECLKGLRALLDARIEQVSKSKTRGEKIDVE